MHEGLLTLVDGVRLTPTQRRIASCLIEHHASAAYLSVGEVADLAQVSQPSVTRFASALGFDGYPALRRALREGAGAVAGPADDPTDSDIDRRDGNEVQRGVRREIEHLTRLADRLADGTPQRQAIDEAGKLLAASRPLPVLGLRAAAPMAAYFGYFAAKVHPDVRVLDHGGSVLVDRLEQARCAGASAMLAVVLPRYPREALDGLREAHGLGLSTVVLTDSPVSPAAELADVALSAAVGSRLIFDLHAAPMALAMVVLQAMCDAAPADTQARLEDFEASAARRGLFAG